jgi:acyl-CoA synthetase (AMP-forming)/AMP-acid ligase II
MAEYLAGKRSDLPKLEAIRIFMKFRGVAALSREQPSSSPLAPQPEESLGPPAAGAAAHALFCFSRQRLAPFTRIRRLEFADLPKTISGKIRRVELRAMEKQRHATNAGGEHEYWEDDFVDFE